MQWRINRCLELKRNDLPAVAMINRYLWVKADVPAVKEEEIHVSIDGNRVSISAEGPNVEPGRW